LIASEPFKKVTRSIIKTKPSVTSFQHVSKDMSQGRTQNRQAAGYKSITCTTEYHLVTEATKYKRVQVTAWP
jgi:hypothetical protein